VQDVAGAVNFYWPDEEAAMQENAAVLVRKREGRRKDYRFKRGHRDVAKLVKLLGDVENAAQVTTSAQVGTNWPGPCFSSI
jgi:hypothetical protein